MGKKIVLKSLGLYVTFYSNEPKVLPHDYPGLNKWLKFNPAEKIKDFNHWFYLINDKEFHFKLKRVKGNTWNVYELETPKKIFLSFDNFESIKFKEDLEDAIRDKFTLVSNLL
jgi:hypothetical protein